VSTENVVSKYIRLVHLLKSSWIQCLCYVHILCFFFRKKSYFKKCKSRRLTQLATALTNEPECLFTCQTQHFRNFLMFTVNIKSPTHKMVDNKIMHSHSQAQAAHIAHGWRHTEHAHRQFSLTFSVDMQQRMRYTE